MKRRYLLCVAIVGVLVLGVTTWYSCTERVNALTAQAALPRDLSILAVAVRSYAEDHGGRCPTRITDLLMTNQLNEVIAHRLRLAAIYLAANRLISEMSNSEIIAIERQEDGKKVLLCALADGSVTEASVNGTSDVTENSRLRVEEIKDDAGYPHYVINRVPRLASSSSAPASSNNNGTGIEH